MTTTDEERKKRRWFFVWFNLRAAGRSIKLALRIAVLGPEPYKPVPSLCATHSGGSTHPSELCKCSCGPEGGVEEHDANCPWLAAMCRLCGGSGHCSGCWGDGCNGDVVSLEEMGITGDD